MSKTYNVARKCDWIFFYSEEQGRFCCVPVGSRAATQIEDKVIKGFHGSASDAIEELARVQEAHGVTGIFPRHREVRERRRKND